MNKKGAGLGIAIIVSIMFFVVGIISINYLTEDVSLTRASDKLDCSNASGISDGNKLLCLSVDLVIPYFILLVFSAAGGYIIAKFII